MASIGHGLFRRQFFASNPRELRAEMDAHLASLMPLPEGVRSFMLFWGPAGSTADEIGALLQGLPIPAIGASTAVSIAEDATRPWSAITLTSRYIAPHVAYARLAEIEGDDIVERCVTRFVGMLGADDYFGAGKLVPPSRVGAHDVRYARPAYLLVFLPGMGASPGPHRPTLRLDVQLVEALASKTSRSVALFGGSAAAGLDATKLQGPWVAAHVGGHVEIMRDGLVGILVESDLSFGYAHGHGLRTDVDERFIVQGIDESTAVPEASRHSRPRRGHGVETIKPDPEVNGIAFFPSPQRPWAPDEHPCLRSPDAIWNTLVVHDGDEDHANPPYVWEGGKIWFLRPLAESMTLYRARATRRDLVEFLPQTVRGAVEQGMVERPAAVFVVGCKGRLRLLGPSLPSEEVQHVRDVLGGGVNIVGMYGDGETCPNKRGTSRHRNWTTAVLVLGEDFHPQYAAAAREALLARVDRSIAEQRDLTPDFQPVLDAAVWLAQADDAYIRLLSADGKFLEVCARASAGKHRDPPDLDITERSPHKNSDEYRAFYHPEGSFHEYQVPQSGDPSSPETATCLSVPIRHEGEPVGLITLVFNDALRLQNDASARRLRETVAAIARRVALPIRLSLMRSALTKTLIDIAKATTPKEVAQALVAHGAFLVGRRAYVSLLLPEPDDAPLRLVCASYQGPIPFEGTQLTLSLESDATPEQVGICGVVFREQRSRFYDDVTEADGRDGHPKFKACIPDKIEAEYVLPILDPISGQSLGVLNVEAGRGVLHQGIQRKPLEQLALAVSHALTQQRLQTQLWHTMERLLPRHISDNLKAKGGEGLEEVAPPTRKIVTMLYADIRGYTEISSIIGEARLAEFMHEYYHLLAAAIAQQRGTLDKFMGDGVIALYGDFSGCTDEEVLDGIYRAVKSGLDIATGFTALAARWLPIWRAEQPAILLEHPFSIGVAIHTGEPIVGLFTTGETAIGRLTYTAIGVDMNVTARAGAELRDNSVWVTNTTWQRLQRAPGLVDFGERVPLKKLKGIAQTIEVTRVVASK